MWAGKEATGWVLLPLLVGAMALECPRSGRCRGIYEASVGTSGESKPSGDHRGAHKVTAPALPGLGLLERPWLPEGSWSRSSGGRESVLLGTGPRGAGRVPESGLGPWGPPTWPQQPRGAGGCPGAGPLPAPGCSQHSTGGRCGLGPAGLSVAAFPAPLLSLPYLWPRPGPGSVCSQGEGGIEPLPAQGRLPGVLPSVASWKLCNNRALFWASSDLVLRSVTAGSLRDRKRGGSGQSKRMGLQATRLPACAAGVQVPVILPGTLA